MVRDRLEPICVNLARHNTNVGLAFAHCPHYIARKSFSEIDAYVWVLCEIGRQHAPCANMTCYTYPR